MKIKYTLIVILSGLSYFISTKLSHLLVIPPDFASAAWPPAGIALAFVLYYKRPAIVGLSLGSFLSNAWPHLSLEALKSIPISLITALIIASGTTLQAYITCKIIAYFNDAKLRLDSKSEVIKFLLISGPLGCTISATVGVTCLFLFNIIEPSLFLSSWFTWWIGDTVGAITLTPLVLSFFENKDQLWRNRRLSFTLPTELE